MGGGGGGVAGRGGALATTVGVTFAKRAIEVGSGETIGIGVIGMNASGEGMGICCVAEGKPGRGGIGRGTPG